MRTESVLFIDTVNELLSSIKKAEMVIRELMQAPALDEVVTEVSDTLNQVTILEPAILNLRIKHLTDLCNDIVLIGLVHERDAAFEKRTSQGDSWYELAQGPRIVSSIQAIRECFGSVRVDIKDGRRIYELVQEGTLKPHSI